MEEKESNGDRFYIAFSIGENDEFELNLALFEADRSQADWASFSQNWSIPQSGGDRDKGWINYQGAQSLDQVAVAEIRSRVEFVKNLVDQGKMDWSVSKRSKK